MVFFLLSLFCSLCHMAQGISVSQPGIKLRPQPWKFRSQLLDCQSIPSAVVSWWRSLSDHGTERLKQNGKGNWRWNQGTERSRKSHRHTKRASLLAEFGMKRNTLGLVPVTSINKGQDQAVSRWRPEERVWHNGYGAWASEGAERTPWKWWCMAERTWPGSFHLPALQRKQCVWGENQVSQGRGWGYQGLCWQWNGIPGVTEGKRRRRRRSGTWVGYEDERSYEDNSLEGPLSAYIRDIRGLRDGGPAAALRQEQSESGLSGVSLLLGVSHLRKKRAGCWLQEKVIVEGCWSAGWGDTVWPWGHM